MKKIFLIISFGLGLISCDDYIDEAFRNPNAPTLVKPSEVLPAIQANMARGVQFDSRMLGRYVNYWTLTTSGGSWDRMGYDPNSDNGGEKWRTHYWNLGQNVVNMMRDARAEGKDEYIGAGHAIMAWSWLLLTDYHNDVILKEAFKTSQLTFKFDTQEDVYKHVAILCDSANVYLDKASKKEVSSDFRNADAFLYAGNIDKWKKFVSGVKAKLLHRYSLKSTYKPDDVIKAVDALIKESVAYAFKNSYDTLPDYIKMHSQEMSEEVMRQHINLYVNDFTIDMGDTGKKAIAQLEKTYSSIVK
jgi:hypothetical protein